MPPLLRPRSSDESAPLPPARPTACRGRRASATITDAARRAANVDRATTRSIGAAPPRRCGRSTPRTAAASTRCPTRAVHELDAAEAAFRGDAPVDRRADPSRRPAPLGRRGRGRARGLPAHGRSRPVGRPGRPASRSTARRGPRSCSARRRPRSRCSRRRPGPPSANVLTNAQIAAARDVVDRYAGTGRVLTHTIVHPNLGAAELDAMADWRAQLAARRAGSATRCTARRRRRRRPAAGSSTTTRSASRSSNGSRALGPRVVAAHKGLGGPIPDAVGRGGVAARHRPGRGRVPRHRVRRVPLGLRARSRRQEGPYDRRARDARRRPAREERRGRGHRPRRQRLRRAGQHVVPDAAPARAKPRTCSASCSARSDPNASCGAPTRRGTGHRSR